MLHWTYNHLLDASCGDAKYPNWASCFEAISSNCHLPSLANKEAKHYYYVCKCMVETPSELHISCKIKKENGEGFWLHLMWALDQSVA
jgi:hypothetical protein